MRNYCNSSLKGGGKIMLGMGENNENETQEENIVPGIGSTVYYKLSDTDAITVLANNKEVVGHELPAIVTKSNDDGTLDLQVFGNSQGAIVWKQNVAEGEIGGTWNLPEDE